MKHILSIGILCLLAACSPKENQKTFVYEGNPLVRNNFTADLPHWYMAIGCICMSDTMSIMPDKIRLREAGSSILPNGCVTRRLI